MSVLVRLRFCCSEYKHKAELMDHEEDDSVSFNNRNTWFFNKLKSGALTGDEIITIPHLLILVKIIFCTYYLNTSKINQD